MAEYGLTKQQHQEIATALYEAERANMPISQLTPRFETITLDDAYAIQKAGLDLRLRDGAKIVGRKIGITSRGMMELLHCDTPDYGCLLDRYLVQEGTAVDRSKLNIPIVEGELAFVMGEDVTGDNITVADIYNATAWVVPCFEVCDARFPDWIVTVRDTISDNAGASRFMIGSHPKRISEVNLRNIGMVIEKNGALMGTAAGAEVMGSPVNSMMWLANKLREYGDSLKKGDIVLSGAFLSAIPAEAGDTFTMSLDGFPSLTMKFE